MFDEVIFSVFMFNITTLIVIFTSSRTQTTQIYLPLLSSDPVIERRVFCLGFQGREATLAKTYVNTIYWRKPRAKPSNYFTNIAQARSSTYNIINRRIK
jgi:hypothetical protein